MSLNGHKIRLSTLRDHLGEAGTEAVLKLMSLTNKIATCMSCLAHIPKTTSTTRWNRDRFTLKLFLTSFANEAVTACQTIVKTCRDYNHASNNTKQLAEQLYFLNKELESHRKFATSLRDQLAFHPGFHAEGVANIILKEDPEIEIMRSDTDQVFTAYYQLPMDTLVRSLAIELGSTDEDIIERLQSAVAAFEPFLFTFVSLTNSLVSDVQEELCKPSITTILAGEGLL